MYLVHLASKGMGAYESYPNVDIPFHFLGGLSIAYTSARILAFFESEGLIAALHRGLDLLLLISLTATVAVFWEFAEFLSDQFLNTNLQPSIASTMQDQLLGILGGACAIVIIKRSPK